MRKLSTLTVALPLTLALSANIAFAQQGLKEKIVGTWKLVSWESIRPDGRVVNLWMGPHPTGVIMYQSNGYMAVQIMADPRPTFKQNPSTINSPDDEFRKAFFGYYAYWGTYTINEAGTGVVHHLQGSLRPSEVGIGYRRSVSFDGTKVVITTPRCYKAGQQLPHDLLESMKIPADEEQFNRLTFERSQ